MHTFRRPFILAAPSLVLCVAIQAHAGRKVTVGRLVSSTQRISMDQVDHSPWNGLLNKYVDRAGQVDYKSWKKSPRDTGLLDKYLNELSQADAGIKASRNGQLAFWINAYNAVTIKGILREYPTSSIRNHTAKLYGYNIWHDLLLVVGNTKISLNDIEHNVLRKSGEPRIHFAIVCASRSCPRLLNEAYTAHKIEKQLVDNTRHFFADTRNFRYNNGTFYLSSIMKWFATDFGEDRSSQLQAIAPYLPDRQSQQAAARGAGRVSYLNYDWNLNDQAS